MFGILTSRVIDWYMFMGQIREGGGGGVPQQGFNFFGAVSSFFLGHFHGILNISSVFSAQAQSIGTLLSKLGKRGGSIDMSKSQRHTRLGAGREVSQANGAAITPNFQDCASMR
jgi:hypothetical protein